MICCTVLGCCGGASGKEFVGGGAWGEGQTPSSLGFILQCVVAMATASSLDKMAAAVWQQQNRV